MLRYCHFWILLGIISLLLVQCSPGQANECESNTAEFILRSGGMQAPQYCVAFNDRFNTDDPQYRINFTESEVESVCSSEVCKNFFELVILGCITFAKKDLNCLDSPGLINVWCGNSDQHNNTNCFTSLINQGVISTPSLLTPCLDAIYNAESCPTSCRELLENSDCCFASYYAFMIDVFLDESGQYPVFENHTMFLEGLWEWCDLPTPTICPDLNLMDYSPRFSNVTCNGDANCNGTNCDGTDDDCGGTITQRPLLGGFYFFITFMILVVLADV